MVGRNRSCFMFYDIENNQTNEASKLTMQQFRSYSIKEELERTRKLWKNVVQVKIWYLQKRWNTLMKINHYKVNKKDTSNNFLNPQPEAQDLITNSCISLSE